MKHHKYVKLKIWIRFQQLGICALEFDESLLIIEEKIAIYEVVAVQGMNIKFSKNPVETQVYMANSLHQQSSLYFIRK